MRNTQTITNREKEIRRDATLLSRTNLKGVITYASKDFCEASEYAQKDMMGQPHNMVRHPEMPKAAFADLWNRIKAGHPWRGMVKNLAGSGDHYWVEAQVAPQYREGKLVGYMSVRRPALRTDIQAAEKLYEQLNKQGKNYDEANPLGIKKSALNLSLRVRLGALVATGVAAALVPVGCHFAQLTPMIGIAIGSALGMALIPLAWWFSAGCFSPLATTTEQLKFLAEGDLTRSIDVRGENEVDRLLEGVQILNTSLSAIIFQLKENSADLNNGSKVLGESSQSLSASFEEISQQSGTIAAAATQMGQNLENVSASAEEMSISLAEVAGKAAESAKATEAVVDISRRNATNASEAAVKTEDAQGVIRELGNAAKNIGNVIDIIQKIAEQTNMLALNAAIEAAGAGEAGKGFAVVASEVKELARQTATSSDDIKKQIESIQKTTDTTIESIKQISDMIALVNNGNSEIATNIEQISQVNTTIAAAVEEQSTTTKEITKNIGEVAAAAGDVVKNINGISQGIAGSVNDSHKVSALASELGTLAGSLAAIVSEYKVVKES